MDTKNNRIGCACWYRINSLKAWRSGILRMWAQDSDPAGIYPSAVVEDGVDGTVESVFVANVCFAASPPMSPPME